MGALFQSIAQGAGRAGNELAEAKTANEERQQKMKQFAMQLQELHQRLKAGAAPQLANTFTDEKGTITNVKRDPLTGSLTNEIGGKTQPKEMWQPFVGADGKVTSFNKGTGEFKEPLLDGKPITAQQKGKNGVLTVDGVPIGVYRNGKPITPGDEGFTAQDAKLLSDAMGGYSKGETNKNERIKLASASRVSSYLQSRMYGVMDADTGALLMVPAAEISKNPGKYAPPGPSVTAKNRDSIFKEIEFTSGMLKDSIAKLPAQAFDESARAQVAMVLRDEKPRAAWYNFLNSEVASGLSPEQIDYVTALVSMDESAMSLRAIGGMGQGSDALRSAITKMLPGASTPSRAYAERQLRLFDGELKALRTSVPGVGGPEHGGGKTQGGATHFTEGDKSWDIPASMVEEFKKAHPNAR